MSAAPVAEREEQWVAFRLAGETYGVPIVLVQEIIRPCEITQVPRAAGHVRGVVNLRGKIVPVMDLRRRLGLPAAEETRATRIIIVEVAQGVVGMIVDSVSEVLRLASSEIEPPSNLTADVEAEMVRGIGKRDGLLVILLDIPAVLRLEAQAA